MGEFPVRHAQEGRGETELILQAEDLDNAQKCVNRFSTIGCCDKLLLALEKQCGDTP